MTNEELSGSTMACDQDTPLPHFTTPSEAYSWLRRQIGNGVTITIVMNFQGVGDSIQTQEWIVVWENKIFVSNCLRCATWNAYGFWKKAQLAKIEAIARN